MKYIIDSVSDGIAVLEDENKEFVRIPESELPDEAREGSVVILCDGCYVYSEEETQARRQTVIQKRNRLLSRKK